MALMPCPLDQRLLHTGGTQPFSMGSPLAQICRKTAGGIVNRISIELCASALEYMAQLVESNRRECRIKKGTISRNARVNHHIHVIILAFRMASVRYACLYCMLIYRIVEVSLYLSERAPLSKSTYKCTHLLPLLLPKPNLGIRIPRPAHRTLPPSTLRRRTLAIPTCSRRRAELDTHLRVPHLQWRLQWRHRSWLRLLGWLCEILPCPRLDSRLCGRRHRCKGRRTSLVELLRACWALEVGLRRCLLLAE